MSNELLPEVSWLDLLNPQPEVQLDYWDPGFDSERLVVLSKLGLYRNIFLCPLQFTPRFYHHIYPLAIEEWHINIKNRLYGGFCTITADLNIHFQASFLYAKRNFEALPNINEHIRIHYQGLIKDAVNGQLSKLKDGQWIHTGLQEVERRVESIINEMLLIKQIQCRTICVLDPYFEELSENTKLDGRFTQSAIYLDLLQKNFEFCEQQKQELLRQEEALEQQRIEASQKQLEYIADEDEIARQKLELETLAKKRQFEAQETQYLEQQALEMRLCLAKINHEKNLKEMELDSEIQLKKDRLLRQQQFELELSLKQLEHERIIKERALIADGQEKERAQMERQKSMERLEVDKIQHENRLNAMQLESELKNMQLRAEASKNKDMYLRREIEWLVLDKQRAEMARSIRDAGNTDEKTKQ